MKDQILKIAGVKSEKEFYKKYPTEEAFQKAHGKEFKKAKLGAAMTPKAQDGSSESISNFMNSVGNKNCVGATWHAILGDGDGGGSGGAAAKVIPEWKEISNIENLGLDKAGRKALKSEYEAIKDKYKGLDFNTYVAAKRDAERTSRQFANPERAKYFDQSGKLLPNVDVRNIDPYLRFYREKFPTQSKLSAEDVLGVYGGMEGGLSNYEKYANVGYQKPMKEGGQLKKLQQLTDFGNPPQAQIGAYIGGQRDTYAKPMFFEDFSGEALAKSSGISPQERERQEQEAQKQEEAKRQEKLAKTANKKKKDSNNSSGGGLGGITKMIGGLFGGGSGSSGGGMSGMFSGGGNEAGMLSGGGMSMMAKKGKKVPKLQNAQNVDIWGNPVLQSTPASIYNPQVAPIGGNAPAMGTVTLAPGAAAKNQTNQTNMWGTGETVSKPGALGGITPSSIQGMNTRSYENPVAKNDTGKLLGSTVGSAINMINALGAERDQARLAERDLTLAQLSQQAASGMPEQTKRRYVRPEDALVQPNQRFPTYGVGTNVLARDGASIGGNPTEIQNTYNPGNIYSDLGFEPLSDSDIIKQYRAGGFIPRANFGSSIFSPTSSTLGSSEGQAFADKLGGGNNAGGNIGSSIGGAVGGPIGSFVGRVAGDALDPYARRIKGAKQKTESVLNATALQSGLRASQGQYSSFVRNGGDIPSDQAGWMSHNWNPQVITKFGDIDVSQMHNIATKGMDTLRTGGHISQNNIFPTDQYALGGELKTTWGGYAEPISHNPYMPGSGETVMFRGKSHEESDGRGHTGIGVKYGDGGHDSYTDYAEYGSKDADADVEVERGEPATEMIDGETGEKNMVVFGNLKIPNQFLHEIGDPKAKGKKFKNYVADLGKIEAKQNRIVEKASDEIDNLQVYTPFDKLKIDALQANITGANMKLKESALRKSNTSAVQNAINDTAEEHGIDADALAKGKIKIDKEAMKEQAKFGKMLKKAQKGYVSKYGVDPWTGNKTGLGKKTASSFTAKEWDDILDNLGYTGAKGNKAVEEFLLSDPRTKDIIAKRHKELYGKDPWIDPKHFGYGWASGDLKTILPNFTITAPPRRKSTYVGQTDEGGSKFNVVPIKKKGKYRNILNQLLGYLPTDQEPFDYSQLYPEMMALAMNQLEPVQGQTYHPDLDIPYDISLQDQLNANQADFNALQRQSGYNPEALSSLAAQKYMANEKVLGEQFRLNQAEKAAVYSKNRDILNDAQLKNLGILDTQMTRQEEARSKTKQQAIEAMKSMTDKIAKNKLENRTLGIYENLYKYRFDDQGRAINWNPTPDFNTTVPGAEDYTTIPSTATPPYVSGNRNVSAQALANPANIPYFLDPNSQAYAPNATSNVGNWWSTTQQKNGGKTKKKDNKNGSIVKAIKNL